MRGWSRIRHGVASIRRGPSPRLIRRVGRRLGVDAVRAGVYSPIPDERALPDSLWTTPAPMPGVDLRIEPSLQFLERDLAPFVAEYRPDDARPSTPHGYYRDNSMYPAVDAEVLYAIVRWRRPRRIVELGAGFSSLVISDAIGFAAAQGEPSPLRSVFDPFPSPVARSAGVEIEAIPAERVPDATFDALDAGDLLVIDTTHTVRPAGDVVRLLLGALPRLRPGVVVHIHDFFRPYEYPRWMMSEFGLYWQEHHLMQAFLACNDSFRVLIANYALTRAYPDRVGAVIPRLERFGGEGPGSALWIERVA